ncbi:hypothetical protein SAMN05444682_1083 [Parapedobacter indicus]|uniref:Uncharacterized protein n=1 Tax=Parapedobacter indicus TaxID=1477437 RepID=A0A1I3PCU7_9SPHI|nr:hypothetical protein CLV26_1083 [Parapedobacter indicus]SFJ19378.1 hypothetical protein SAMN05444682_1083 [Parapedobacter indicus]
MYYKEMYSILEYTYPKGWLFIFPTLQPKAVICWQKNSRISLLN